MEENVANSWCKAFQDIPLAIDNADSNAIAIVAKLSGWQFIVKNAHKFESTCICIYIYMLYIYVCVFVYIFSSICKCFAYKMILHSFRFASFRFVSVMSMIFLSRIKNQANNWQLQSTNLADFSSYAISGCKPALPVFQCLQ